MEKRGATVRPALFFSVVMWDISFQCIPLEYDAIWC